MATADFCAYESESDFLSTEASCGPVGSAVYGFIQKISLPWVQLVHLNQEHQVNPCHPRKKNTFFFNGNSDWGMLQMWVECRGLHTCGPDDPLTPLDPCKPGSPYKWHIRNENKLQKPVAHDLCSVYFIFFSLTFCPGMPASPGNPGIPWKWRRRANDHVTVDCFELFDKRFKYDYAAAAANNHGKAQKKNSDLTSRQSLPHITALAAQTALSNSRKTINK